MTHQLTDRREWAEPRHVHAHRHHVGRQHQTDRMRAGLRRIGIVRDAGMSPGPMRLARPDDFEDAILPLPARSTLGSGSPPSVIRVRTLRWRAMRASSVRRTGTPEAGSVG